MSAEESEPLNPNSVEDVEADGPPSVDHRRSYPQGDDDDTEAVEALRQRLALRSGRPNSGNTNPTGPQSRVFMPQLQRPIKRDPLYIFIPYAISFLLSFSAFSLGVAGYVITLYGPFDDQSRAVHRKLYEGYFIRLQSIFFFLGLNTFWTLFNLIHAYRGCQENLWLANHIYDFLLWAVLIAFPVLNMFELLLADESMCSFNTPDGKPINEYNEKCESWKLALLVVEMVFVNLGLLLAVIHFGLMIGRCCTHSNIKMKIRERIAEEEGYLMELMERRRILEEQATTIENPLSALPTELNENTSEPVEEDLIDIAPEAPGRTSESEFTPYTSADGSDIAGGRTYLADQAQ